MENTKRKMAWDMAEKYECYSDLACSLDNGTWPCERLDSFLREVYDMDCNVDNFGEELNRICDKHKIV